MKQANSKTIIITGANNGIGFETAKALAQKGHHIIMACRDISKAKTAKNQIQNEVLNAKIKVLKLDLSSFESIKIFSSQFSDEFSKLDILINNAGIMARKLSKTNEGFESQFGVNYLGHFLLSKLLFPKLNETKDSRIVSLSSIAHRNAKINIEDLNFDKKFEAFPAYAQSKLACLMFSYELDRKLKERDIDMLSVAAHPGVSITNIGKDLPSFVLKTQDLFGKYFFSNQKQGAESIVMAATKEDLVGGEYFGPSGFREIKGKPKIVKSNKISYNVEIAKKLWQKSEELTNTNWF